MKSIFDLLPININPFFLSRLNSNVDAALLLEVLNRDFYSDSNNEGYIHYTRKKLMEKTGLSENKLKKAAAFLKKKKFLKIKIEKGFRLYFVNQEKYSELLGYKIYPSLIRKLKNNSKATYLLKFILDYYNFIGDEISLEIPSSTLEILSGLDKNSQIYARDTLLGLGYLKYEQDSKTKNYFLVFDEINKL